MDYKTDLETMGLQEPWKSYDILSRRKGDTKFQYVC